jgi:hypothetical protein
MEKDIKWVTMPPVKLGYYWAYEALDAVDADVLLVQVLDNYQCLSIRHNMLFPKDHFSHWIYLEKPNPPDNI